MGQMSEAGSSMKHTVCLQHGDSTSLHACDLAGTTGMPSTEGLCTQMLQPATLHMTHALHNTVVRWHRTALSLRINQLVDGRHLHAGTCVPMWLCCSGCPFSPLRLSGMPLTPATFQKCARATAPAAHQMLARWMHLCVHGEFHGMNDP